MNLKRIFALIKRDYRIVRKVKRSTIRIFYFPIVIMFIWGFFVIWAKDIAIELAFILLTVNIFWQLAQHTQGGMNIQIMEDRWSESYKQIILSPITSTEYLVGKAIFAIAISVISFTFIYLMAYFLFDFTILLEKLYYFLLLSVIIIGASIGVSIFVESMILAWGNEYGFFAWSATQFFILFSAPFFPMTIYPPVIQQISAVMPYTWIFESIRALMNASSLESTLLLRALGISIIYLIGGFLFYRKMFEKARKNGKLVKIW